MQHHCVTLIRPFNLAVITLTIKILFRPYLRNCKVKAVNCWIGHVLGSVGVLLLVPITLALPKCVHLPYYLFISPDESLCSSSGQSFI